MSDNSIIHITREFSSRLRAKEAVSLVERLGIATSIRVLVYGNSIYLDILASSENEAVVRASTNFGDDIAAEDLPMASDCSEVYSGGGVRHFRKQVPYAGAM